MWTEWENRQRLQNIHTKELPEMTRTMTTLWEKDCSIFLELSSSLRSLVRSTLTWRMRQYWITIPQKATLHDALTTTTTKAHFYFEQTTPPTLLYKASAIYWLRLTKEKWIYLADDQTLAMIMLIVARRRQNFPREVWPHQKNNNPSAGMSEEPRGKSLQATMM